MSVFASPRFLSRVLAADATSCAATGALQVAFTHAMARLTGLPPELLLSTGLFLLVYAAAAAWIASRAAPPRGLIGLVLAGNLGWAAACVALLLSDAVMPTPLGLLWVAAQAVTVLVLAELQWAGLRRTRGASAGQPALG